MTSFEKTEPIYAVTPPPVTLIVWLSMFLLLPVTKIADPLYSVTYFVNVIMKKWTIASLSVGEQFSIIIQKNKLEPYSIVDICKLLFPLLLICFHL